MILGKLLHWKLTRLTKVSSLFSHRVVSRIFTTCYELLTCSPTVLFLVLRPHSSFQNLMKIDIDEIKNKEVSTHQTSLIKNTIFFSAPSSWLSSCLSVVVISNNLQLRQIWIDKWPRNSACSLINIAPFLKASWPNWSPEIASKSQSLCKIHC